MPLNIINQPGRPLKAKDRVFDRKGQMPEEY